MNAHQQQEVVDFSQVKKNYHPQEFEVSVANADLESCICFDLLNIPSVHIKFSLVSIHEAWDTSYFCSKFS